VPGGAECGSGLGGALLGVAEFGDGLGEGGEADQQHDGGDPAFLGEVGVGGDKPGGVTELVPGRGGRRDAPVGLAGGTLERVGGLAQGAAAERGGRHVQRVRCRVRSVGGGGRVAGGGAVPYPGLVQPGEELGGAGGCCGGGGDVAAQRGPEWLTTPVAGGFAGLGAGRRTGRGARSHRSATN
jgi:hypothetical protein